jgi:lambda family phage holin
METEWLKSIANIIGAVTLSMFLAILRVIIDGKETKMWRILLEGLFCGGITCAVVSLASWYGLDPEIYSFLGGFIGLVGSAYIRQFARKLFEKRFDK